MVFDQGGIHIEINIVNQAMHIFSKMKIGFTFFVFIIHLQPSIYFFSNYFLTISSYSIIR